MTESFRWNPYADQPHNVASRKERFRQHLRFSGSYISLVGSNLRKAGPVLSLYRKYRKNLYSAHVPVGNPFGLSVSPVIGKNEEVVALLKEINIRQTLVRIPSWEKSRFPDYEAFLRILRSENIEPVLALLQQREDVRNPSRWEGFMEEVFSRFREVCSFFEVGHACNRTKWGVWDYREYLRLARPAVPLSEKHGIKLVGPAVIDFEFHLYPPVLREIPFDKVSSLFYVDRAGAPENTQFGWDTSRKLALLKAVVDACSQRGRGLWITETNWPLKGTGKYSPASGKPNVTEDQQASFLVRYYVLCLASGLVERIFWWQLAAPGYGLVDTRKGEWRRRPSFFALKTLVSFLEGSTFRGKIPHPQAEIFAFTRGKENFAVCWVAEKNIKGRAALGYCFPGQILRIVNRDGQEIADRDNNVVLDAKPQYVFYSQAPLKPGNDIRSEAGVQG